MNLTDLRYDHPRTFWTAAAGLTLACTLTVFFNLPVNGFFEAAGVNNLQRRAIALKNATYWYSRSLIHASAADLQFETRYGNVVRYEGDVLHSSIPEGDAFQEVALQLADVVVTQPTEADGLVRSLRFKDARFEVYDRDKSVVWIESKPLNVVLIEVGAAQPDPNPPTNIVDIAFASYYWNQAKGESQ